MDSFFTRYKNSLVLALVLMVQFVLLAVQVRPRLPGAAAADQAGVKVLRMGVNTVVTPPEKVLHRSGLTFREIWSSYVNLVGVKEQNRQLQEENQRLQLEQAALAEDARQGQRLQELLAFKQNYVETTVPSQVVGTDGSDHQRILYIDKGSEDGLKPDMPVITPDGVVGKIRDVAPHSSQVLEISDPTSAAGVLLEETRTRGIVRGDTVGHTEIVNLMPDDRIKPGQLVLTSGGDQVFPRGLPVGIVDRVVPDLDNQPLIDVVLKPSANLGRLEEVLVVTGTSPVLSAKARHDLAKSEGTAAAVKAAAVAKAEEAARVKAEAALEAQRASDVLAQRLPSASNVDNPDAPDAAPGSSPATAADADAAPLHPPSALHADHFSPGTAPKADSLTPGQRLGPYVAGTPSTERMKKTQGDEASLPSPEVSPAFRAAHDAAIAARPHPPAPPHPSANSDTATPGSAVAAPGATGASAAANSSGAAADSSGFVLKPLIRRVPVLNPDGTPTLNADGTPAVKRVPVLNPDGTPVMHRVPLIADAAGAATTPAVPVYRRVPVLNPDGTPVLNADGTPTVKRIPVLNPDGTPVMRRAAVPATPGASATPRSAAAVNAAPGIATATKPAARPAQTAGVTAPNGSAVGSAAHTTASSAAPRAGTPVRTQVINDGPLPSGSVRSAAPRATPPAPKKRAPEVVPDDGSRPPAGTPPPASAPQGQR